MSKEICKPPISLPIKPPGPPKVWKVIEIKTRGAQSPIKFTIQEIPEDRYEEVAEYMCEYFIPEEPQCSYLNGKDDPVFVDTFRQFWKDFLKHGLSVAAFTENPNGGKPIIAAVNVLTVSLKGDEIDYSKIKSKMGRLIVETVDGLCKNANVFEKYGVDMYMSAFGLSVHPSYRGAALGGHLLNVRTDIGREYKIPVTSTAFTSPISQKLAERCGFETIIEKDYAECVDKDGKQIFPGIQVKTMKVMAKRLY